MYLRRPVAVLMGAAIAFGGISLAASADAKTGCPKDKGNGHGNQYPPGQCKAELSASSVLPGQPLTVSGGGFPAGAVVQFVLHSKPVSLGSAVADASGTVTKKITIPSDTVPGAHFISMFDPISGRYLTVNFRVVGAALGAGAASTSMSQTQGFGGGASSLATTGAGELAPIAGGGAALVGLGALTLLAARRRREKLVAS